MYYTYNTNEQSHKVGADAIYGGWFVQPTLGVSQTFNRTYRSNDTTFFYKELNAKAGVLLPLNLSTGMHFRNLTLATSLNTRQVQFTGIAKGKFQNLQFNFWQAQLSYASQTQKAVQQIYPRWAQTLYLNYRTIVNKYTAHQFLASGSLYLPGGHPNHSLVIQGAYQARDTMQQYAFSNGFPFSRGYGGVDFPRMWKAGANYHFPLAYPDWGFANIVYFQRLRANAFYDYTVGKSLRTGLKVPFSTIGGELYFDTKWWNQQPVSFGIRYNYVVNKSSLRYTFANTWQVVLPVDLF